MWKPIKVGNGHKAKRKAFKSSRVDWLKRNIYERMKGGGEGRRGVV